MNEQKKRILIVEDDHLNRKWLESTLSSYEVTATPDTNGLYAMLDEGQRPDMIILDVMLSEESGFDVAKDVRIRLEKDVPIIFVSACTEGSYVKEGFRSGGRDYVKKPLDAEEILARIEAAFDQDEREKGLLRDASFDVLTGVLNRRYLFKQIEQKINFCKRKNIPLSLAMIDLDHFKSINDSHSHQFGDRVLRRFADILKEDVRDYDALGRYGGEEFLIAFMDCGSGLALDILERIRLRVLSERFFADNTEVAVSFSAGIAGLEETSTENALEHLIAIADRRLYQAKEQGRNCIVR